MTFLHLRKNRLNLVFQHGEELQICIANPPREQIGRKPQPIEVVIECQLR